MAISRFTGAKTQLKIKVAMIGVFYSTWVRNPRCASPDSYLTGFFIKVEVEEWYGGIPNKL